MQLTNKLTILVNNSYKSSISWMKFFTLSRNAASLLDVG